MMKIIHPQNFIKRSLAALVATVSLTMVGCGSTSAIDDAPDGTGVTIYKNGSIYTVNPENPNAQAVVITDGVITFVGSDADAQKFETDSAQVIDLNGKMLMPGFHDVHMHPIESGSENTHFSINTNETNPENFIPAIKAAAQQFPNAAWLIGYGHDIYALTQSQRSPIEILDAAVNDRPVIIMEQTSHSMWVNSKALELIGYTKNSANPTGGIIMKDNVTGLPNGILIDNAGEVAMSVALSATDEFIQVDYDGMVEYTLPALAKHGITSIVDARAYWKRGHLDVWSELQKENKLTVRASVGLWAYPEDNDVEQLAKLKSLYRDDANSLLRINQIKLYSDGIPSNTTAAMKTPYEYDLLGIEGNKGLNYFTQTRLTNYITELESTGFDFHIHAIGDRGIHESLNAIESAGSTKGRHRLTHIEILDPQDTPRFLQLNVTADLQVAGQFTHPSHWSEMIDVIGAAKADNLVPIKSLQDAGARVTLSSDWSVSPFNPFIGLQNAVTRAPQNLTLQDALAAYTINSAYVMRQEGKVGSIEVGKEADLVILNQNLLTISPTKINKTKILQTLLKGKEVFRSNDFSL
jgi:predicted amidohydrolase YtcJ